MDEQQRARAPSADVVIRVSSRADDHASHVVSLQCDRNGHVHDDIGHPCRKQRRRQAPGTLAVAARMLKRVRPLRCCSCRAHMWASYTYQSYEDVHKREARGQGVGGLGVGDAPGCIITQHRRFLAKALPLPTQCRS